MDKKTFLAELRTGLTGLPEAEAEERLSFYAKMIDDRMKDGLTEEQAVAEIGSVGEVAAQIMSELPLTKLVEEKVKPRRSLKVWKIILLVLGSPVWLSLLVAAGAVYIVIWFVIISLWLTCLSMVLLFGIGLYKAFLSLLQWNLWASLAYLGMGLSYAGCEILLVFVSRYVTKGTSALLKSARKRIKLWKESGTMNESLLIAGALVVVGFLILLFAYGKSGPLSLDI